MAIDVDTPGHAQTMSREARRRYFASQRFWLAPGMGVKRHAAAAIAGGVLLMMGVGIGALWLIGEGRQEVAAPLERVLASGTWAAGGGWLALIATFGGLTLAVGAIGRLNRSLLSNWLPRPHEAAALLHGRLQLARGPRIVALGGGAGLSTLLRGLRAYTSNLTAVVAVSDDGGSSGRLRAAFGMPAPGDLADCLAALSGHEAALGRLLQYRFSRGAELQGHTFGNLLITTLTEVEGDFGDALRAINAMLDLSGAVYPVTAVPVELVMTKLDGSTVVGESRVRERSGAITSVAIRPEAPAALPEVVAAIADADLVVLGPGSLFTSTLPPVLVPDVAQALQRSPARLVYVCNIMTEDGETNGLDAWEHVDVVARALGRRPDVCVVNDEPVDDARLSAYRAERADVVAVDVERFAREGVALERWSLLGDGPVAQHDPERLARHIYELIAKGTP
ncbi:YvcK family protein [soil metagenome]